MKLHYTLVICVFTLISCHSKTEHKTVLKQANTAKTNASTYVKSVMLYDTIQRWPLDSIQAAIDDINEVVASIEPRKAGYSIWKVQSDTIIDYRYLIEGHWPDQASYDSIHVNPLFRAELDRNVHIFTETRKWELYRRYELLK